MGLRKTGARFPGFGWSNTTFLFEGGGQRGLTMPATG